MENLPVYVSMAFIATTILTVFLFYKAAKKSIATITLISVWLLVQAIVSLNDFYTVTNSIPPRFLLLVLPPLVFITGLFFTVKGRGYLDNFNPAWLTLLHVVRIPVELILYALFVHKMVPQTMTFEGSNLDIISGLTAPLVAFFGFVKHRISKTILLLWNFICLALLINIVVIAILSAPLPFQQWAFMQPNIAVLYFPFSWLPGCIVPLVFLSHLIIIRQLLITNKQHSSQRLVS